jgi:hypothetical protein
MNRTEKINKKNKRRTLYTHIYIYYRNKIKNDVIIYMRTYYIEI